MEAEEVITFPVHRIMAEEAVHTHERSMPLLLQAGRLPTLLELEVRLKLPGAIRISATLRAIVLLSPEALLLLEQKEECMAYPDLAAREVQHRAVLEPLNIPEEMARVVRARVLPVAVEGQVVQTGQV